MTTKTPTPLIDLRLSARAYNALRRAGIDTIEALESRTTEQLKLNVLNFGIQSAEEVEGEIAAYRRAHR
jgi:DNA-directed RNA polymerase alpha subunit